MSEREINDRLIVDLQRMEAQDIQAGDTEKAADARAAIQNLERESKEYADLIASIARVYGSQSTSSSTAQPIVMQGDTRRPKSPLDGSQHTGNQPYFDPNSDHMVQIDPLAQHYDLSGDFPNLVNPLKPGPKMPSNG